MPTSWCACQGRHQKRRHHKLGPKMTLKEPIILYRDTIISFPTVIQQWQYLATSTEPLRVAHAGKAEDCAYTWVSLAMRRRRPILASDIRSRSSATGLPASGLPAGLPCTECPLCQKSRIAQLAICRQLDIIKQGSGEAPE